MDAGKITSFNLTAALLRPDGPGGHAASRTDAAAVAAALATSAAFDTLLAEAGTGESPATPLQEPLPRNGVVVNLSPRSLGVSVDPHVLAATVEYAHLKPGMTAPVQAPSTKPAAAPESARVHGAPRPIPFDEPRESADLPRTPAGTGASVSAEPSRTEAPSQPAPFALALQAAAPNALKPETQVDETPLDRARVAERLATVTPRVESAGAFSRIPVGKLLFVAVAIAVAVLVLAL